MQITFQELSSDKGVMGYKEDDYVPSSDLLEHDGGAMLSTEGPRLLKERVSLKYQEESRAEENLESNLVSAHAVLRFM